MRDLCRLIGWMIVDLIRSRVMLEAEIWTLRQRINVLRRTAPKKLSVCAVDRMIFVGLYRMFPKICDALAIVNPDTVVCWHRAGFRLYWRWKSGPCSGRPTVPPEIRKLIREMSIANPLWGAPRIHGEPCAHHRVERTDRDARHEVRSTRSRATSSTKPPPTAAPREPARRQSAGRWRRPCREATAAVLRHGSPFRDHRCVCPAPRNGTQAAAARPTALPIRILHLSPAAHLYLSPDDAVSRISASRSRAFGDLIVERESVCK